jgi:hypothetical protein
MIPVLLKYRLVVYLLFILNCSAISQRTVGLLKSSTFNPEGFILFSPTNSRETFLIDNCGFLIKKWVSAHVPGQTAYLLPNGDLLRAARVPGFFTGGGTGGKIEIFDWDGALKWSYLLANEKYHQHHIAHPMPNGNILTTVWYKYSKEEAVQKGFKPEKLTSEGIWSDRILEIKPLPENKAEIVWEWDFWDHTIQNFDSTKSNYGIIANRPELLDVNFYEDPGANVAEWIHLNALDYNPKLDQIIVSSKFHNEIYIIDHSTTTAEAKGSKGGKYGKGGDFLYRWGNPRSFGRGTQTSHRLYGQHDVQWIDEGLPGAGNVLLFNNGSNRIGLLYSTIEEVVLPIDPFGLYKLVEGSPYGPDLPFWIYQGIPNTSFYSSRISGTQRLLNGNTLICEGNKGNFIEVDKNNTIVWQYRNPISNFGTINQGDIPINNDVFKVTKYSPNYPAFQGKNMTSTSTIELNSQEYKCETASSVNDLKVIKPSIYPNPTTEYIFIKNDNYQGAKYSISDILGKQLTAGQINNTHIDVSHLEEGIYRLNINYTITNYNYNFIFVKNK